MTDIYIYHINYFKKQLSCRELIWYDCVIFKSIGHMQATTTALYIPVLLPEMMEILKYKLVAICTVIIYFLIWVV